MTCRRVICGSARLEVYPRSVWVTLKMVKDSPEGTGWGVEDHVQGHVDSKAQVLLGSTGTLWGSGVIFPTS